MLLKEIFQNRHDFKRRLNSASKSYAQEYQMHPKRTWKDGVHGARLPGMGSGHGKSPFAWENLLSGSHTPVNGAQPRLDVSPHETNSTQDPKYPPVSQFNYHVPLLFAKVRLLKCLTNKTALKACIISLLYPRLSARALHEHFLSNSEKCRTSPRNSAWRGEGPYICIFKAP